MTNLRTAAEFWQQQPFAYLETYSFNRGPASLALAQQVNQEIEAARQALQTARYKLATGLHRRLNQLQAQLHGSLYNVRLADPRMAYVHCALHIATLPAHSPEAHQLSILMKRAGEPEFASGCLPIFRDALVFYDAQGRWQQTLNICFECLQMQTSNGLAVEADWATYQALARLLHELGHSM